MDPRIVFVGIDELKPHEAVKEKKLGNYVKTTTRYPRKSIKVKPLWIDRETKVILDGHHRFGMFRAMGCKRVPCILVDYLTDDTISVLPRRPEIPVSKQAVIEMGLSGKTFPAKTTKHVFSEEAPEFWLTLRKCVGDDEQKTA